MEAKVEVIVRTNKNTGEEYSTKKYWIVLDDGFSFSVTSQLQFLGIIERSPSIDIDESVYGLRKFKQKGKNKDEHRNTQRSKSSIRRSPTVSRSDLGANNGAISDIPRINESVPESPGIVKPTDRIQDSYRHVHVQVLPREDLDDECEFNRDVHDRNADSGTLVTRSSDNTFERQNTNRERNAQYNEGQVSPSCEQDNQWRDTEHGQVDNVQVMPQRERWFGSYVERDRSSEHQGKQGHSDSFGSAYSEFVSFAGEQETYDGYLEYLEKRYTPGTDEYYHAEEERKIAERKYFSEGDDELFERLGLS